MAKKAKAQEEEQKEFNVSDFIKGFLNEEDNKNYHFNYKPSVSYKVSSGSLIFDIELGGGLGPGCYRFIGPRESGKTSAALEFARNFQLQFKDKGTVVYFKAEGRFSQEIQDRSGLDFSPGRFQLVKSNIFEVVNELMKRLVSECPEDHRILFIIDSVDGLITKAEYEKSEGENIQPGTGGRALSLLFKKMSLAISEMGHMAIFISQERSAIQLMPYAPKQQQQGKSSGGNAIQHHVDVCLEFSPVTKSRIIWGDEAKKENKLGHEVEVEFLKSTNERTFDVFSYPIKYGRTGGNSIWREREVAYYLISFKFVETSGKGLAVCQDSDLAKEFKAQFPDRFVDKFTYVKNFYAWFEENPDITEWFCNKIKQAVVGAK